MCIGVCMYRRVNRWVIGLGIWILGVRVYVYRRVCGSTCVCGRVVCGRVVCGLVCELLCMGVYVWVIGVWACTRGRVCLWEVWEGRREVGMTRLGTWRCTYRLTPFAYRDEK